MASFACEHDPVLLSIQDHVAWVTLNRPDAGNRLDVLMLKALMSIFQQLHADEHVRVIMLQAQGKDFCLGADVAHMKAKGKASEKDNYEDALLLTQCFDTVAHVNKPCVAIVHGHVYGGGVGLVACADMVLCDDAATFCLSELKLGLIPAVISPYVVNAVGMRRAKRWMMTACAVTAEAAEEAGLVDHLFNVKTHQALLEETIQTFMRLAPNAMISLKALMTRYEKNVPIEDRAYLLATLRAQPEAQEGLSAFLEKRTPAWVKE